MPDDPRLDPRIKAMMENWAKAEPLEDVESREQLVAAANTEEATQQREQTQAFLETIDNEDIAPSAGLIVESLQVESAPDGNTINIQYIRPDSREVLPCVYYIHGGGMANMSCYYGNYRAWGKIIASNGVAVAMVDFRNCVEPSSVAEVAPFPAGLNDCVSGLRWIHQNADRLNIDGTRIVVSGESGGGNLTLATGLKLKQDGDLGIIQGLYAFCPYIAGYWPQDDLASSQGLDGRAMNLHSNRGAMGYGIEQLENKNPLAWPGFATHEDLAGLPPVIISVNECDPLRDEGIRFYRTALRAGVSARCRQIMGTPHATEVFPIFSLEITRDGARDLAAFCKEEH